MRTAQDGNTPAHLSAIRGHAGTLELLVQAKANLEATNAEGLTVLGAGLTPRGAASAIQLLEAHGATITDAVRDRLLAKGGCAWIGWWTEVVVCMCMCALWM